VDGQNIGSIIYADAFVSTHLASQGKGGHSNCKNGRLNDCALQSVLYNMQSTVQVSCCAIYTAELL
jgi:hypothetical protein